MEEEETRGVPCPIRRYQTAVPPVGQVRLVLQGRAGSSGHSQRRVSSSVTRPWICRAEWRRWARGPAGVEDIPHASRRAPAAAHQRDCGSSVCPPWRCGTDALQGLFHACYSTVARNPGSGTPALGWKGAGIVMDLDMRTELRSTRWLKAWR